MTANEFDNDASVLLNSGHGQFGPKQDYRTGEGPTSVAIGDANGDGKPDLVVAAGDSDSIAVLLNAGHDKFAPKTSFRTGSSPYSVALGDLNGDGKLDVTTANFGDYTASVLLNDGKGGFTSRRDYEVKGAWAVALADVNGDKKADLAVTGLTRVFVLLGAGDGKFGAPHGYQTDTSSYTLAADDVNGDGKPDLVTANTDKGEISVLLNKGDGTFDTFQRYSMRVVAQAPRAGTMLAHGAKVDLVVSRGPRP